MACEQGQNTHTAGASTDDPARTPRPHPPHEAEQEAEPSSQDSSRLRSAAGGGHAVSLGTGRRSRHKTGIWGAPALQAAEPFCTKSVTATTEEGNPSPSARRKAHHRRRTKSGPKRTLALRRQQTRAARRDHTADCWRGRTNDHSDPGSKPWTYGAFGGERGGQGSRQGCGGQQTAMLFGVCAALVGVTAGAARKALRA